MDNYDARSNIDTLTNELTYNTMSNLDYNKEMISTTPVMDVRIENLNNDISNLDNLLNEDGTIKMKYEISNVDFGIVERPRQDIKLEKRVTKISMVLQNGQILIDATVNEDGTLVGTTTGIKGPTPKPAVRQSNNSISGLITAEIDSELIHGSTLELEYEIVVKNIGELDYTTEEYYKYGVIDDSDAIVKISPTEIVDYMDNTVVFAENEEINKQSSTWEQQDEEAYKVNVSSTVYLTNGSEYKNKKILLTKYYQENNIQLKPGEVSNVLKLKTKKLLSARNDILVNNETEVIKLNKTGGRTVISTPGNYIPGMAYEEGGVNENDDDMAETFTITPPTGAYKNLIVPVATMVIAITILGVGIVIIKKKIL
ncbi:MAG: hypothetical protein HUJ68_00330 [Clostridia bacterium]|nr:hypothetical protein [Clostridia bacterium]